MSLKSMATMSESLSEKHVHLQLRLIDVKCDGELLRIVAYDVGLFAIDLQKGIARGVIESFATPYLEDTALQNPRPTP
jgi:hypothetical protein